MNNESYKLNLEHFLMPDHFSGYIDMFDDFKLHLNLTKNVVDIQLEINNIPVHHDLAIDLRTLAKSCQNEGKFYIFTCVCGEPGCAGYFNVINVTHLPNMVIWNSLLDSVERTFGFDPVAYQSQIDRVIHQTKLAYKNHRNYLSLSIYAQQWQDILRLNTQVFNTRLNGPEKRLIARYILITPTVNHIEINGMCFSIEELHLPSDIIKEYCDWVKNTQDEYLAHEANAYAQHVKDGYLLLKLLITYLGKQSRLHFSLPTFTQDEHKKLKKLFGLN